MHTFFTNPLTSINSPENQCFENDFPINNPIDFEKTHPIDETDFEKYQKLLEQIGAENPIPKLTEKKYAETKERIKLGFERLSFYLRKIGILEEKSIFITIGNSMESYGYMLKRVFPELAVAHIKVSRTLKDNTVKFCGATKKDEVFAEYFEQKILEILPKNKNAENIILIDTVGAGETSSQVLAEFIKQGLKAKPEISILMTGLLEAGHISPTPPYDQNVEIKIPPQISEVPESLLNFKNGKSEKMPVLAFNEFFETNFIQKVIKNHDKKSNIEEISKLSNRFRLKKLHIFLDVQRKIIDEKNDFIIIPSQTTKLLKPINPYITVTQKTVFLVKNNKTGKFISRDGFGYSRQEQPPMILHRLNNSQKFRDLTTEEKICLILKKCQTNLDTDSNPEENERIMNAFESFLRKKVIYHQIAKLSDTSNLSDTFEVSDR